MTSWLMLMLAILFEVGGTTCMKLSEGFTRWLPSVALFVLYGLSFTAMTYALKRIDVSVAYAIWSGMGTALIAAIGIVLFREQVNGLKLLAIAVIIAGVVMLNLAGGGHPDRSPPSSNQQPSP